MEQCFQKERFARCVGQFSQNKLNPLKPEQKSVDKSSKRVLESRTKGRLQLMVEKGKGLQKLLWVRALPMF